MPGLEKQVERVPDNQNPRADHSDEDPDQGLGEREPNRSHHEAEDRPEGGARVLASRISIQSVFGSLVPLDRSVARLDEQTSSA
jgi:hypothetical protein